MIEFYLKKQKIKPNYTRNCFSQLNLYKNAEISFVWEFEDLQIINVNLDIKDIKIIQTLKGISIEGQFFTGKKLIVIGYVFIDLSYKTNFNSSNILKEEIPFSSYIIIPDNDCTKKIYLEYFVEDYGFKVIDKNKLFLSTSILLKYI